MEHFSYVQKYKNIWDLKKIVEQLKLQKPNFGLKISLHECSIHNKFSKIPMSHVLLPWH